MNRNATTASASKKSARKGSPASATKAPVVIALDDKRLTAMARRLGDAISNPGLAERILADGKAPHTWVRNYVAKTLGYENINTLQALVEGVSAGQDASRVVEVSKDVKVDGDLVASLLALVNNDIDDLEYYGSKADEGEWPRARFIRNWDEVEGTDAGEVLYLVNGVWTDTLGEPWAYTETFEDRDGLPVYDDGEPLGGVRIDLPSAAVTERIVKTLIHARALSSHVKIRCARSHVSIDYAGPETYQWGSTIHLTSDNDRGDISPEFVFSRHAMPDAPVDVLPDGVKRLYGVAALETARATGFPLMQRHADGVGIQISVKEAESMLESIGRCHNYPDVRKISQNGSDDIYLDIRAAV